MSRHRRNAFLSAAPLAAFMIGCASAKKAHYLQHIGAEVSPGESVSPDVAIAFGLGRSDAPDEALVQAPDAESPAPR